MAGIETPTRDARGAILDSGQRIIAHRGFAAVGLTEVLSTAGVPKGSFYHHFGSKDAFGEAMLQRYFTGYLADMDRIAGVDGRDGAAKLFDYFAYWRDNETADDCAGKCLAVKLGAEVADLSEAMRRVLEEGVSAIVGRIEAMLQEGVRDGSVRLGAPARDTAQALYDLWLGSSVVTKITRRTTALDIATSTTKRLIS